MLEDRLILTPGIPHKVLGVDLLHPVDCHYEWVSSCTCDRDRAVVMLPPQLPQGEVANLGRRGVPTFAGSASR